MKMANLSRPKRWTKAISKTQSIIEDVRSTLNNFSEYSSELEDLKSEYENWKYNLPENLQSSTLAEKLDKIYDLNDITSDIDEISNALDNLESSIGDYEATDLPLGFGRD
jgi:chromosome segregation ATPase